MTLADESLSCTFRKWTLCQCYQWSALVPVICIVWYICVLCVMCFVCLGFDCVGLKAMTHWLDCWFCTTVVHRVCWFSVQSALFIPAVSLSTSCRHDRRMCARCVCRVSPLISLNASLHRQALLHRGTAQTSLWTTPTSGINGPRRQRSTWTQSMAE